MTKGRVGLLTVLVVSALVLPIPVAAGGGCHPPKGLEPQAGKGTDVDIAGCTFVQTVTYAKPGATVTWTNSDGAPHTVTGALNSWGSTETLNRGDSASVTFPDEGVYPYYCLFHPGMVGAVVVGDGESSTGAGAPAVVEPADPAAGEAAPVAATTTSREGAGLFAPIALGLLLAALAAGAWTVRRRESKGPLIQT